MKRRTALKSGVVGATSLLGLSALSGTGSAWDGMTINVDCVSPTELAKVELEGGEFQVESDFGSELVDRDGSTFTFEDDGEQFTIDIEGTRYEESEELREFAFTSDTDRIGLVVVKGGSEEETFYVDATDEAGDGSGLHAPVNPNPPTTQYYGVSNIQFYECTELEVAVTDIGASANSGDVIDLTDDEVRFGVWHGSFHRDDDYVFENGVAPAAGDRWIDAEGDLRFKFPLEDVFIDDADQVKDSTKFVAELLIREDDGDTWAGQQPFPTV